MIKLIKLFLPTILLATGLQAMQLAKYQTESLKLNSWVRLYLEAKAGLLKSGYAYNKIKNFLENPQICMISDTIEHGIAIAKGVPTLRRLLYANKFNMESNTKSGEAIGHLGDVLDGVNNRFGVVKLKIISADCSYLATSSTDKTVRIWNGQYLSSRILLGHNEVVTAICFSPDSQAVVTGSNDKIIYWNLENSTIITCLAPKEGIAKLEFINNNNKAFVSTSNHGIVKTWQIENGEGYLLQGPGRANRAIDNKHERATSNSTNSKLLIDRVAEILKSNANTNNSTCNEQVVQQFLNLSAQADFEQDNVSANLKALNFELKRVENLSNSSNCINLNVIRNALAQIKKSTIDLTNSENRACTANIIRRACILERSL